MRPEKAVLSTVLSTVEVWGPRRRRSPVEHRAEKADIANFRPERANFGLKRADFGTLRANSGLERADFGLEA